MALPAGRRGIRANLVKSDGTIRDLTKLKEDFAALSASDIPTIDVPLFKSLTGNPVTISDAVGENAKCAKATLEPIQDLHGYDHPWPAGGWKNLYPDNVGQTINSLGCTSVFDESTLMLTGTATGNGGRTALRTKMFSLKAGTYYLKFFNENLRGKQKPDILFQIGNENIWEMVITLENDIDNANIGVNVTNGLEYDYSVTIAIFQIDESVYSPYSNICPISGRTQVEITNKDSEDVEQASVTVDLGRTVYGGTLNVTTGELVIKTANIASYNGESIGVPWWSSVDEYVAGATPTTGAQVVYTLETPTTVSLTPAQIQLLTTTNVISTNADVLSILYRATEEGNVEGALQYLFDKVEELSAQINE